MRVFVTGASGFIGSAVIPQLLAAGHQVLGLARSDASAKKVEALGAKVLRGDLNDLASLKTGAMETEGVIHLGFIHDFSNFAASLETDRKAIETMGKALEGTHRPFVIASGLLGLTQGTVATESTPFDGKVNPRAATALMALELAQKGVRVSIVRLSPTVHGEGDHGFVHYLAQVAKQKGFAGYPGEGTNHWNAINREDAARVFVLALEKAKPGEILHAVDEGAITTRAIAEALGKANKVPVKAVPAAQAAEHFGWIANFFSLDQPASNDVTREHLGWKPTHQSLLADIEAGYYTV